MSTDVLKSSLKQNSHGFPFRRFFPGRKVACKSKVPQGITALKKKSLSPCPESGEFVPSDNSMSSKRSRKEEEAPESGEIISSGGSSKRTKNVWSSRAVIHGCRSVEEYTKLNVISSGSYGVVYRARNKRTGVIVAVKEEFEGLSKASVREISILKSLGPHPCIIQFKEVVVDECDGVYIVMEYLDNDLKRYMDAKKGYLTLNQVKLFMKQLLQGVKFLHQNGVMHRDLKPSNILVDSGSDKLKICDFGLSRHLGRGSGAYSTNVMTIWYRAPELLLGAKTYTCAIDMWSVGCIMGELVLKEAAFQGWSEIEQLAKIYNVLGTPCEAVWPGFDSLPGSKAKVVQQPYNMIMRKFSASGKPAGVPVLTGAGFNLLNRLLSYDPARRITAEAALNHAWFKE